jgi:hypothetical protein
MLGTRSLALASTFCLLTASAAFAGPCTSSIDDLQARVDSAIDRQAGAGPWKVESTEATRSRQPTPKSIAAAEGPAGKKYQHVLVLLKRARSADRAGNLGRCNAELDKVRSALDAM